MKMYASLSKRMLTILQNRQKPVQGQKWQHLITKSNLMRKRAKDKREKLLALDGEIDQAAIELRHISCRTLMSM